MWEEEGEKQSKYFCYQSRNFLNNIINTVEAHNNNTKYDECGINHQVKIFYESLFFLLHVRFRSSEYQS